DSFKHSIPGWIIAFVGFAIALTGTIMWIVGASRRRRVRQMYYAGPGPGPGPPPAASGPPAGWYPDPQVSGRQRYWDGTMWTDHYAGAQAPAVSRSATGSRNRGGARHRSWRPSRPSAQHRRAQ